MTVRLHAGPMFAQELAARSAAAMAAVKQGLRRGLENNLAGEWEYYVNTQAILLAGPDFCANVDCINEQIRGVSSKS